LINAYAFQLVVRIASLESTLDVRQPAALGLPVGFRVLSRSASVRPNPLIWGNVP
jgi:hypothetical protein